MVDKSHKALRARRQSELLSLNRSSLYLQHCTKDDSYLCNLIVEIYLELPIYGYRRITAILCRSGTLVNRKRVQRLMQELNLRAIYPGPNTSKRNLSEMVHPYLLSGLITSRVNEVWQVDITYIRTNNGFVYLVAFIDVYSRLVVGWRLSNSLCTESALRALEDAISKYGAPDIVNSDQGAQFTSEVWMQALQVYGITISMTGKGRCNDNANIERLWRSFKYEGSYLYKWHSIVELKTNIPKWIRWYNFERPHQSLKYQTPFEKYYEKEYCGFMDKSDDLPTIPQTQQLQNLVLIL